MFASFRHAVYFRPEGPGLKLLGLDGELVGHTVQCSVVGQRSSSCVLGLVACSEDISETTVSDEVNSGCLRRVLAYPLYMCKHPVTY